MIHRFVEVSYDPFVEVPICGEVLLVEYPLELPVEPPVVPSHARPVRAKGRVQGPLREPLENLGFLNMFS